MPLNHSLCIRMFFWYSNTYTNIRVFVSALPYSTVPTTLLHLLTTTAVNLGEIGLSKTGQQTCNPNNHSCLSNNVYYHKSEEVGHDLSAPKNNFNKHCFLAITSTMIVIFSQQQS